MQRVVDAFDPKAVILFGSRARGSNRPTSDWDLLVIVDDEAPAKLFDAEFCWNVQRKAARGVHADIVPCKVSVFQQARKIIDTLSREAEREGLVVYER
jgi:predicted nucleotidyltransferase